LNRSKFPVFLFDEEEGSGIGALRGPDGSLLFMFFEELFEFFLFRL
jgi:hypothetical protein